MKKSSAIFCGGFCDCFQSVVLFLLFRSEFDCRDNDAGQYEQSDDVGNDHDVIEHIGKLPNQVVGEEGTEENKRNGKYGVHHGCFLTEEVLYVLLTEEVPADDRSKGEEGQTESNQKIARGGSEDLTHGGLHHVCLGDACLRAIGERTVTRIQGRDGYQSGEGEYDKGIDKYADHCDHTLIVGLFYVCLRMSVRSRTHTCLVGEQTSLGTLADRRLDCCSEGTAEDCLRLEGVLEDHAEGLGDLGDVEAQNDHAENDIENCHDGNDLFSNRRDSADSANEDEGADCGKNQTDHPSGHHGNSGVDRFGNGVGLYHGSHEAQCQCDGYGEEAREELAEAVIEGTSDVVNGSAKNRAVLLNDLGLLCENCLGVDGCHTEEGNDPHPEDGTGATHEDRAAGANDVARTDLRGDGGCQCLEGGKSAIFLSAAERNVAKDPLHAFAKATNLHEARTNGIEQTDTNQKEDEDIV